MDSEKKLKTKEEKANEKEQILAKRRKHNMKLYPIYIMMTSAQHVYQSTTEADMYHVTADSATSFRKEL